MTAHNIAIVGATGLVGETLLSILHERNFSISNIYALASKKSVGKHVKFGDKTLTVEALDDFDFSKADIVFFSAGGSVSKQYVPEANEAGCLVIDNTSEFRYQEDVPLIVPEVNGGLLKGYQGKLIANPNCSTIQMVTALKPIYDAVGIAKINVATYQSVSGAGRSAISHLQDEARALLDDRNLPESNLFSTQMAFNVIPQIDVMQDNGYSREEMKMVWETHKIFDDERIQVNPTAVRVPVMMGHAEAVHLETREPISMANLREILSKAEGVCLLDDHQYPTPAMHSSDDRVSVGRLRKDLTGSSDESLGVNMWIVANNIRKGAALNAVQIAELCQSVA